MRGSVEKNWVEALQGRAEAYRELGIHYLRGAGCMAVTGTKKRRVRRKLAYLCLECSAEMGDAKAFYLLNHYFNKGKRVIDDASYRQIAEEYAKEKNPENKRYLQYYLKLGTKRQRAECRKWLKSISGQAPAYRPEQDAAHPEAGKKKASGIVTAHR